jgi:hypothetical protein
MGKRIVTEVLEQAGEAYLQVDPLAGFARDAIVRGVSRRRQRLFDEFVSAVATHIDSGDHEAALELIADYLETEAGREAFDRALRAMNEAASPTSRECLAVLVSHYAKRQSSPDRTYKRVAAILSDAVQPELIALRKLAAAATEIMRTPGWSGDPVIVSVHAISGDTRLSSGSTSRSRILSKPFKSAGTDESLQMLVRQGIGRAATVARAEPTYGDDKLEFSADAVASLDLLVTCLSVVQE